VYRPGQEENSSAAPKAIVLRNGDILTVPELLPGWEMAVESIWAPEFD
jgi:Uma2 family endonuclease